MNSHAERYFLNEDEKNRILDGSMLQDTHMDKLLFMISKLTNNEFRSTLSVQNLDRVKEVPRNKEHIQIIHSCNDNCKKCKGGHWICLYFNTKEFIVYDSYNSPYEDKNKNKIKKELNKAQKQFVRLLFPYMDEYPPVPYPEVDQQQNQFDCGVFAIAFATSLVFQKDPSLLEYDYSLMRSHLFEMFTQHNALIHFPIIREKEGSTTIFYNYLPKEIDIEI
ncbi:hypothetical protein TKK_0000116 [Trichogramma kaykai]